MTKVKLGSILTEQKESVKSPDGKGMDLIGVSNEIGLHVSRAKRIDDLSRYKFIEMGWFAYNPMRINVGSIGYVYKQDQIGIVSPDYVVFSCSDKILPEYLLYLLKSDEGIEAINKNASGAVRKRLYFSDLARIEIVLPSIESQRNRLNSFRKINELGNQISEHKSSDSLVSQLKQSILQEAIQGKLTAAWRASRKLSGQEVEPASELLKRIKAEKAQLIKDKKIKKEKPLPPITEEEIPFDLPEGWVWCRLGEISEYIQRGKSPKYVEKSNVPVISQKCVQWDRFDFHKARFIDENTLEKYEAQRFLTDGDLLWNSTGDGTVGRLIEFVNNTGYEKIVADSHVAVVRLMNSITSRFILSYLSTKLVQDNLVVSGSTKQTELSRGTIINQLVPLPPSTEQKAIVQRIESLMEKCRALEAEITQSEQHAQLLMQAVLKEAFESSETPVQAGESKKEKTADQPALSIPENKKGFAKLVLAGKIISECKDSAGFTNIKFQKLQHLAEHLMEADLNLNYYNQAAGPYDNKFMHTVHNKMSQQKWFTSQGYKYASLEKSKEIDGHFNRCFEAKNEEFKKLMDLLGKASEKQCEIISTLYAVWNDRIIKKERINDEALIEDFLAWSNRKQQYTADQLTKAISWMKEHQLEPKGFGQLIKHAKKKK